jgi:hypothetical protein
VKLESLAADLGSERLRTWFAAHGTTAMDGTTLQALISALEEANGGTMPDDVAVLVLTRTPVDAPPSVSLGAGSAL